MRLIDADALIKWIDDSVSQYGNTYSTDMLNMWGLFKDYLINNAPTVIPFASVETQTMIEYERPQGKWLNDRVAFHFTCDYCGCNIRQLKSEVFEGDYDYNFCPNCGAEMRGDNND